MGKGGERKYSKSYRLLVGRSLLQEYKREWLKIRKILDDFLEKLASTPGSPLEERVQGGVWKTPQDALLELKAGSREYRTIERKIKKMESILAGMTEEELFLVEAYHWRGAPWYELAKALNLSQTSFYRLVCGVEDRVGREWIEGEGPPE